MNTPLVTVVLPVYNAAATVEQTIASVQSQSLSHFELIVVDDGSTDDSATLIAAMANRDPRIRLIIRKNAGVSSARNLGVSLGKAPFIAFIDADDIWVPEKLRTHITHHLLNPDIAASYARVKFLPQHATSIEMGHTISTPRPDALTVNDILGDYPICTMSNLFVRRDWFDLAGGFDSALSHAEDQALALQLIVRGAEIMGIDALLAGYRFSPDGLSMDLERMKMGWHKIAEAYANRRELASLEALYFRYLARRTLRSGGPATKALSYAFAGLQIDATSFLSDRRRGLGTLAGALVAPFMPAAVRRQVFA